MKRLSLLLLLGSVAALLPAAAPLALAQGTYTQIDYPGAASTFCYGIDTAGDISGYYVDSSGTSHGFLLSGGIYTTIDYPGAQGTYVYGINDEGQVVGFTAGIATIGFVYNVQAQTFTEISHNGSLAPTSINNGGEIAGYFAGGGFELVGSKFIRIKFPHSYANLVWGMSASGEVVGDFINVNSTYVSFLFDHGTYRRLSIPAEPYAQALGISSSGTTVVGIYYVPSQGLAFLYQNETLQTLQFPGSADTGAIGINDAGEVVGVFYDASNILHGFTWTPPADAEKK